MIIEKILGNRENISLDNSKELVNVFFDWFETEKKRIFKVAEDGLDLGLQLSERLRDGDILFENEKKIYIVTFNGIELNHIKVNSSIDMGLLCFELGNRHLSLKIEEHDVYTPFDQPTFDYLKKSGFNIEKIIGKFDNFIECKAHGKTNNHSHHHSHEHEHGHEHKH